MPIARIGSDEASGWVRFKDGTDPLAATGHAAHTLAGAMRGAQDAALPDRGPYHLLPPLERGARVICIGLNYRLHAEESGHPLPAHPVVFFRTQESLVGPDEPMILPRESARFDYEGELAIVIGQGGRRIKAKDASSHICGYTIMNDGSVRDFQKHTSQFAPGKNFDGSGALGPWIAEAGMLGDVGALSLETTLNGEVMQASGIDDLIFGVPELISYLSSFMALRCGDIIATGTPSGVGGARKPPRFMAAGDEVSVTISGIGTLTNRIEHDTGAT